MEQNVDVPNPGGGLHDLPVPGSSSSSTVSRDKRGQRGFSHFSQVQKKCDTTSALWVGTASALELMAADSL